MPPLAEIAQASETSIGSLVLGLVALVTLLNLVLQVTGRLNGKSSERQIEPTNNSATQLKIDALANTMGAMNREMGATRQSVEILTKTLDEARENQREDIAAAHRRIDALSKDVSRHDAEISCIQRNCQKC